jgi:SAM-dependent MidA family methyltransferase
VKGRERAPRAARITEKAGGGRQAARFEDWMRVALYDPELGYYARNVRGVGWRGDFSTAATLHPALGEAIAAWASSRRKELFGGGLGGWNLVEAGPGTGELARTVLRALPLLARRTVTLHLVETSPVLREAQRARLGGLATWHATMEDALAACGGRAIVYASELLDAFPVQVLRRSGDGWQALWVSFEGDEGRERAGVSSNGEERPWKPEVSLNGDVWQEEWRSVSSEGAEGALPTAFSALSRTWPEGQRIEIAPAVRSFLLSKKSSLSVGSFLLLDYGDTIDRLYDRRPNGTVRGYAHHVRLEGPELYRWGGTADVTADVNFTDVSAWAAEAGFAVSPLETQGAFLARHVEGVEVRAAREPALAFLLDPRGAGAGFKALELRKGPSGGAARQVDEQEPRLPLEGRNRRAQDVRSHDQPRTKTMTVFEEASPMLLEWT